MKKKFGAILMAGAMACTVLSSAVLATGCGKKIQDFVMPENGFDTESPVEIKFYHTMGQDLRKVLQSSIEQFNVLFPNVKVVETQIGKYEDVRDQIITEINAAAQPNLAYCYPDHVAMFNQSGAVLPLNDFLTDGAYKDMTVKHADGTTEQLNFTQEQTDAFIEGYYEEGYQFDDGSKMYTLPFSKSTEVLFYNKTFFEKNEISVPKTWDDMEQVCKKIKELDPNCTPLGYDSESNWFITMCKQYGSDYTSADGEHFLFDNEQNRKFVETFKGWYDKGYFITQAINKTYTSNLFVKQNSYMCIGSSAGAKNQIAPSTDDKYDFEVGIASIPQVNPENPKVISQGPSICIFKQNDPQQVLASWLLAKFLTSDISFQAQFSVVSGYVPVLKTVIDHEVYKEHLAEANGTSKLTALSAKVCMEQEAAYYTSPAFVGSSRARDEVGALMQAVFTESKTLEKAFSDAIQKCRYYAS